MLPTGKLEIDAYSGSTSANRVFEIGLIIATESKSIKFSIVV
ncbi:hypothetical protein [Microcoleus sp. SVA1_A1]